MSQFDERRVGNPYGFKMTKFNPTWIKPFKMNRLIYLAHTNPNKFRAKTPKREWIPKMYGVCWPERIK